MAKRPRQIRVDHGMVQARGGIGRRDPGIGTEVTGQIERQLYTRREFCEALINTELEIERAVLVRSTSRLRRACRRRGGHDLIDLFRQVPWSRGG